MTPPTTTTHVRMHTTTVMGDGMLRATHTRGRRTTPMASMRASASPSIRVDTNRSTLTLLVRGRYVDRRPSRRSSVVVRASRTPKEGQRVSLHYTMTLSDGTVVDDTRNANRGAVTVTHGDGALFPKIASALGEMTKGDQRVVELTPSEAFGEHDESKISRFPLKPEEAAEMAKQVQPGQLVQLPQGQAAMCLAMDNESVTLDMNHPLAGQTLTFALELLDITDGITIFGTPMVALKL
jgi:FKBP-type peptidyl-prolyl cis-trans isomerase 2